jgi:ArsR family transcriptional regulator
MVRKRKTYGRGAALATEWAGLLRIMAHPARLTILDELSRGMKCVTDIRDLTDLPQPNVSQHLALLKRNGLVVSRKQGAYRCYFLANPEIVCGILAVLKGEKKRPGRR